MTSVAEEPDANTETEAELESARPSDAFGDLGNEVRTAAIQHLFEHDAEPVAFSELFEANPADTTAGFAYHLRQLAPRYVRKSEEGYRLTYAGRRAAREVAAGSYIESHDVDPIAVADSCPFCGESSLVASGVDNHITIACTDCQQAILTLPFPPGGHRTDDAGQLLAAFDRHHRHRLAAMSDGSCPECAAAVAATVERVHDGTDSDGTDDDGNGEDKTDDGNGQEAMDDRVQLQLDCPECGCRLRCPVTLAVLAHPAVISFAHDHDEALPERPIWNVGPEWGERLLSTDPWCVLVTCRLSDELLEVYVSRDLSVVETRRRAVE